MLAVGDDGDDELAEVGSENSSLALGGAGAGRFFFPVPRPLDDTTLFNEDAEP